MHWPVKRSFISQRLRGREQGSARISSLILACVLLGGAASAFWWYRVKQGAQANEALERGGQQNTALSPATLAVLKRLNSPLEIRFYSSLDPGGAPGSFQAFAGRVEQLVKAYERDAAGKITVAWFNSPAKFDTYAAAGDGIKPVTEKGTEVVLGIALVQNGKKEVLAQLSPEWEQTLEPDLTRAIARLIEANRSQPAVVSQNAPATLEEIKRALPNLDSVSVGDGTRILRESALKDLKAAISQFDAQIKEAQQRVADAQNGKSEAEQQAALKHLQEVQAEQVQKIKDIAAHSKAQVEVFEQLKQTNR